MMATTQAQSHSHSTVQQVPASPTLTNPDMILPYNDVSQSDDAQSPTYLFNVSSPTKTVPSDEIGVRSTSIEYPDALTGAASTAGGLGVTYEHGAPLSDIGEEESIYRSSRLGSGSVTPIDARSVSSSIDDTRSDRSDESASTISAGSDANHWKGFDSEVLSTHERKLKQSEKSATTLLVPLSDTRRSSFTSLDEDAESNALSERAERILANAKRRLTVRVYHVLDVTQLTMTRLWKVT